MKTKIRRRCKCGCGEITNYGKKYVHGHNPPWNKNKKLSKEITRKMSIAKQNMSQENKLNISISKMGNTYRKGTGKTKIRRRCKCGCGKITNPGKVWICGHHASGKTYMKDKKVSIETKRKLSESSKEHWQDPSFQKKQYEARTMSPNKPELELGEILNKLYPNEYKYVGDFQFWLGGKNPDFMNINGQKKLIELYGDYWHAGQDPQDRINHFKQYGFNTLIIWEHELKKSRLQLRRRLMDFHRVIND